MRSIKIICSLFLIVSFAGLPALAEEVTCVYCGMKRSSYGHSWMVISYKGVEPKGYCSVHCAAIAMALHTDLPIDHISVGDFNTKKQINAEKASWVVGGDLPGVMTARAKWAFETREAADAFITKHGGRLATFEQVLEAAFDDMLNDTRMIRKKRKLIDRQKNHSPGQRE
jgi:copper chaperone NosL